MTVGTEPQINHQESQQDSKNGNKFSVLNIQGEIQSKPEAASRKKQKTNKKHTQKTPPQETPMQG